MSDKLEQIVSAFKKKGCRVTRQRVNLVSTILKNPGCSCKEIFYLAKKQDDSIGRATVYRTVRSLEELGFIKPQSINII
ncbi:MULTISPECIES: transcriptional repressor [Treponema]|jgi:Fe2+ or Zn2+ uptake regulation protein|uniref:Fe2+ or Zn2+ uptake regulation protein n=1 Tax=Treponema rectale TaxID=744512 RepID=A0A840SEZ0_9SPIR|nr:MULTISPECIES: transcriptional repressor [Treponema]MBB5219310.1 Fe2+ or Zn2+ uptake regulation protein [Treponema rectale]MBE6354228.1 ferric uptake regulator family protein [Treponema sp.]MBO6177081.1 transcriptional repressor [Treponema sp.]QOS40805.1 ferric uptake regulator family protein [Treponema rectale]